MKKIILIAGIAISFAGCKKEEAPLVQPQSSNVSMDDQVKDVIRRADKNLYEELYASGAQRAVNGGTTFITGYFRIPPGGTVDDGWCLKVSGICMVIVHGGSGSSGGAGLKTGPTNLREQSTEKENLRLVINTPQPIVKYISEYHTSTDMNGNIHVTYK